MGTDFGDFECQVKVFPKCSGESWKGFEQRSNMNSAGLGESVLVASSK